MLGSHGSLKRSVVWSFPFLGREDLLHNKLTAARTKDLADVELLRNQDSRPASD